MRWFHLNYAKVMVAMVTDKLVLSVCTYSKVVQRVFFHPFYLLV